MSISPQKLLQDRFIEQINTWLSDGSLSGQLFKKWLTEELHRTPEEMKHIAIDNFPFQPRDWPLDLYMRCTIDFLDGTTAKREWTQLEVAQFVPE